jgi:hypothetical protein
MTDCKSGFERSAKTRRCIKKCPSGSTRNVSSGRCKKDKAPRGRSRRASKPSDKIETSLSKNTKYVRKNMAKKVFDTRELSELIYEFSDQGREEHQGKQRQVCQALSPPDAPLWGVSSFENILPNFYYTYYDNYMRHDEDHYLVKHLQEDYSDEQLSLYAEAMKRCRCCSRHSHYKNVPFKPNEPLPESKKNCDCACPCRRLYRLFKANQLA